jgi:hypothetical protein
MSAARPTKSAHVCEPERGHVEGLVYYSSKSDSWIAVLIPPGQPFRQQRLDVRFCPWCGRDLGEVELAEDAELLE